MTQQHIIILGGGLGGLMTGAMLAHHGQRVTVLERSHTIGGGLQTFVRHGFRLETGMHVVGGFQPGGTLHRICRYLGILDRLDLVAMPADCGVEVNDLSSATNFRLPQGREAFTDYLIRRFPEEAEGIRRYVASIYDIVASMDLYNLRQPQSTVAQEKYAIPIGDYLAQFTRHPQLLRLLAYMSPLYGALEHQTPAYVHALLNVLYINGTQMFASSSQQLADALSDVIRSHGGEVLTDSAVTHIQVENRQVRSVTLGDGRSFTADVYVSSLHPVCTIDLCSEGAFPRATVQRLRSIPNSYSAFKVYYEVRADRFPQLTSPVFLYNRPESFWQLHQDDELWPQCAILFMTSSKVNAAGCRMLMAVCPMSFDAVRTWSDSRPGHRPEAYLRWKESHLNRLTSLITLCYPEMADAVVSSFAATPLTFRDWLQAPEGNIYGYSKDASNILLSHLPIRTKVSNLLFTGQNINLHGICGVPLTAILTAEAILGQDVVLDAINRLPLHE